MWEVLAINLTTAIGKPQRRNLDHQDQEGGQRGQDVGSYTPSTHRYYP